VIVVHTMPVADIYPHTESRVCACGPAEERADDGLLVVHNSWDGREADEDEGGDPQLDVLGALEDSDCFRE
jgi:antitoxin (DNA-binding transcriptional repressor) of toxin-antitoxin stability system